MDDINEIKERYGAIAQEKAENLKENLSEVADQAKVRSQEFWADTSELIRENPAASIGIALLAGAVIGGLLVGSLSSDRHESVEDMAQKAVDRGSDSLGTAKDGLGKTLTQLRSLIDDALTTLK